MSGSNLVLKLDARLQEVVYRAFGERRGALVAIEPSTGGVLAFVSKPGFDPNLFVDGIDQENWNELNTSLDRPMVNRAMNGTYPPGSTFKPFMALAALFTGKRTPSQAISDPGFYIHGGHHFRDDKVGGHGIRARAEGLADLPQHLGFGASLHAVQHLRQHPDECHRRRDRASLGAVEELFERGIRGPADRLGTHGPRGQSAAEEQFGGG